MRRNLRIITAVALALVFAGTAFAKPAPAQKCQSAKNTLAGKYEACRQKAEAKFASTGDRTGRTTALQKCLNSYALKWPLTESNAVKAGGACPSTDDQTAIQGVIDSTTTNIATALAGGVLPDCAGDLLACQGSLTTTQGSLTTCTGDLSTCNGSLTTCSANLTSTQASLTICTGNLGTCNTTLTTCQNDLTTCQAAPQGQRLKTGQTQCWDAAGAGIPCAGTGQDGELQKGLAHAYVDNGDGTITDTTTGLMWEKLANFGRGSIHSLDTVYRWTDAFAVKVAELNDQDGFAGYTDWRVPNVNELQSIVDYGAVAFSGVPAAFNMGCPSPCNMPTCPLCAPTTCSCTARGFYWSSSTARNFPDRAWAVFFGDGNVVADPKSTPHLLRAVRGGS